MEFKQKEGESSDAYLKRLFAEGDRCVSTLEKTFKELKEEGVIKFCKHCGANIYKDKKHECSK